MKLIRFSKYTVRMTFAFFCFVNSACAQPSFSPENAEEPHYTTNPPKVKMVSLSPDSSPSNQSLFDFIFEMKGVPKLEIKTNFNRLINKKINEKYQPGTFKLSPPDSSVPMLLNGRVRTRGNMRKKVSFFPPLKLDFKKSELDSLGLVELDKLKLVFPKNNSKQNQERLFKEFLLYEIYSLIDSNAIKAKLLDISIVHNEKQKHQFTGFLIEDEAQYARRTGAIIVEKGVLRPSSLDRQAFIKMVFFQYMISNTDFSVRHMHNLEIIKLKNVQRVIAIPYDFDYSGFVGHEYAFPHPNLPIASVQERFVFPSYRLTPGEFRQMTALYLSIENDIYEMCRSADYMNENSKKESLQYFKSFFELVRNPERLEKDFLKMKRK